MKKPIESGRPRLKKRTRLVIYGYFVVILLILSTVSTYAWFSLTATPRVSNLSIYVNASPGMEISSDPDGAGWSQRISYDELLADDYRLRPATWSAEDGRFYGALYSADGRLKGWEPLSEDRYANTTSRDNYYCVATLYARAGTGVRVSLAPALAVDGGTAISGTYLIGEPEWNEELLLHDNGGKGAECAIRIGIEVTRLNSDLTPTDAPRELFIYEPNADLHNDGSTGYIDTPSIDGSETVIPRDHIISQGATLRSESDPVERDVLIYDVGSFDGSAELFTMRTDEVVMIRLIIWLEGQDIDCTNAIADAHILANLQFNAVGIGDSGLTPTDEK